MAFSPRELSYLPCPEVFVNLLTLGFTRVAGVYAGHVAPEQSFLHQLVSAGLKVAKSEEVDASATENDVLDVRAALATRSASTSKITRTLIQSIEQQRARNDELAVVIRKGLPDSGTGMVCLFGYSKIASEAVINGRGVSEMLWTES